MTIIMIVRYHEATRPLTFLCSFLPVTADGHDIFNSLCNFQWIIITQGIVPKFQNWHAGFIYSSLDNCLKYNANTTLKNTFEVMIISQCIFVLKDRICIGISRGIEWSIWAFASIRAVRLIYFCEHEQWSNIFCDQRAL